MIIVFVLCFVTVSCEKIGRPCEHHAFQIDQEKFSVQPFYLPTIWLHSESNHHTVGQHTRSGWVGKVHRQPAVRAIADSQGNNDNNNNNNNKLVYLRYIFILFSIKDNNKLNSLWYVATRNNLNVKSARWPGYLVTW